jgi:hypothetical protein
MVDPVLDLLSQLFVVPKSDRRESVDENDEIGSARNLQEKSHSISPSLFAGLSSQVSRRVVCETQTNFIYDTCFQLATGMWGLLTLNISILPLLRLDQWQIIFEIIAGCAAAGGYASIKAFEVIIP